MDDEDGGDGEEEGEGEDEGDEDDENGGEGEEVSRLFISLFTAFFMRKSHALRLAVGWQAVAPTCPPCYFGVRNMLWMLFPPTVYLAKLFNCA